MTTQQARLPSIIQVVLALGAFLALAFSFTAKLDLPIQLALFIGWFVIMGLGLKLGHQYKDLESAATKGISNGLGAVLILLSVGALVGTWIAGGIVPTIIYYGLKAIHPSIFLYSDHVDLLVNRFSDGHLLGGCRNRGYCHDGDWSRPWDPCPNDGRCRSFRVLLW